LSRIFFNICCFRYIKWIRFIVLDLILLSFPHISEAQNYPLREYGVIDGLPQSQIYGIFQDRRGFLWITTKNGLSRYDGFDFINYFRSDGLSSNYVNHVLEDSAGTIWAVAREGVSRYNGSGFKFFPPHWELQSLTYGKAIAYNGDLLLSAGLPGSSEIRLYLFSEGVYSDFSGAYPALDTLSIVHFEHNRNTNDLYFLDIRGYGYIWNDNRLTAISKKKYNEFSFQADELLTIPNDTILSGNGVNSLLSEAFAFRNAPVVSFLDNQDNPILVYFDGRIVTKLSLPFNPLGCFVDSEDVLWIKSENDLFRLLSSAFSGFSFDKIGAGNIWTIAEDCNGHIWFGSLYGSLIEYDGIRFTERNEYRSLFSSGIGFFKGSRKMSNGDIWFSTNQGVAIWNGSKFSKLLTIPDNTQICYIYEDPYDKSVLLGTGRGLFLIKDKLVKQFRQFNDSELGIIEGITRIDNGRYLLSGHKGLIEFDGNISIPLKEDILPEVYTYTIITDRFGGIWITSEEGLYFRGIISEKVIHGLPESINSAANSICMMDIDHVLVGRATDICIIDLEKYYGGEKEYYRFYDKSDGFEGSDCIDNGIIKDNQGRFWILTSNNAIRFDPSSLKVNTVPPKLHITGLYFQNDSLEWEPVEKDNFFYGLPDLIKIKRQQNKIQINYTAISTPNPEKVMIHYRMIGIDDKWSSSSSKRSVIFEKLPPGNYQFELKATNADGIETAEPLQMAIKVLPTFWQTVFFKILFILVVLGITIAITATIQTRRHRKKAEEHRLRSELSNLQMNSILRQFDPHFTFNVISSVGSLILKGEKEVAYEYITKLSVLLRTVLSDGSFIVRPLEEELDFVKRYCELQKLRFKERFNFQIKIDENTDLQRKIPKMTIQTFVENAIKHGFGNRKEGGKVNVAVRNIENNLEILIADDGVGRFEASKQRTGGTGNGIKIVIGLFDRMNSRNTSDARLNIRDLLENGRPSGTEVRILIPEGYTFDFEGDK